MRFVWAVNDAYIIIQVHSIEKIYRLKIEENAPNMMLQFCEIFWGACHHPPLPHPLFGSIFATRRSLTEP